MELVKFFVKKCPNTAIYVPDFISSDEEERISSYIERTPKPRWTQLLNRRLINYGGIPHPKGMIAEEIPKWLQFYVDKVNELGIFISQKPNHVLINEYRPGQGIMPHTDGPLYHPIVSTISCGSHAIIVFTKNIVATDDADTNPDDTAKEEIELLLEPRSLLIFKDSLYTDYLHSIRECTKDILHENISNMENCAGDFQVGESLVRTTRISLTIRHVPKTSKVKFF